MAVRLHPFDMRADPILYRLRALIRYRATAQGLKGLSIVTVLAIFSHTQLESLWCVARTWRLTEQIGIPAFELSLRPLALCVRRSVVRGRMQCQQSRRSSRFIGSMSQLIQAYVLCFLS